MVPQTWRKTYVKKKKSHSQTSTVGLTRRALLSTTTEPEHHHGVRSIMVVLGQSIGFQHRQ